MAAGVLMPKAGISVESCIITQWLKNSGDTIAVGDILFSYETDKASFECESTEAGELLEVFFQNGDEVPVLVPVCAIGKAGEDVASLRPGSEEALAPVPEQVSAIKEEAPSFATQVATAPQATGDVKISPRARRLAEQRNIDIGMAAPSGPYGRVIERDIRVMMEQGIGVMTASAYAQGVVAAESGTGIGGRVAVRDLTAVPAAHAMERPQDGPDYEDITFTGVRKAISKSMTASLTNIPQLTHNFSFDASDILELRAKVKAKGEKLGLPDITLNDFILFAVSRLLAKYPELNAHMLDPFTIRKFHDVHLGMAVDTTRGLLVPVIRNANRKSLSQISSEAKELARQAQDGSLNPDLMSGGTFTVSNLGGFGVESFTPVINPPQTGILGVDNIIQRVREMDGEISAYPAMGISLTYDHRAIDGAPASRFGSELCRAMESFSLLLAL